MNRMSELGFLGFEDDRIDECKCLN